MKKVLILGSGLVAKPMVEYLLAHGYKVVLASPLKNRADEMIGGNPLGAAVDWSMDDPETLSLLIESSDITVSLLPYVYHASVARICLKHGKSLVTTSYIQKEMEELDAAAKNVGIIFLNEVGLDPGIDHMSAMKMIDMIHSNGGRVEEFYSLCGALPAPEAANNPMRYKFSWSPKGVLLASLNNAVYLHKGKRIEISSSDLFRETFIREVKGVGELEVYPNRDSLSFVQVYGIPEVRTIYRGTFRYKGWCESIDAFKRLELFDNTIKDYSGKTYSDFLAERTGLANVDLKKSVTRLLRLKDDSVALRSLDFLGFFSDEKLEYFETNPFEITSNRMINKMSLGHDERDMVVLQHIILAAWANGSREVIRSSMIDFGTHSTNTATARTVALPASIAVKLILEGRITATGVHRPVYHEIYNPVLEELRTLGITIMDEYWLPEAELPQNFR